MIIDSTSGKNLSEQYFDITFFSKGGMGEIYKAYDNEGKKEVAIKMIAITDENEETLLSREIEASSKLSGKNIVKTNRTGKAKMHGINYLYIVQDFYSNGNLRNSLRENIPLEECFAMMRDILEGLKIVHAEIVHRDLKPENILIDSSGALVITDFGLAKFIDDKTKTKSFKGAGTIPYMAPECWLFDTNSISMDIYSLGIIFYELLTGKLPINAKSENEWRDFHVYEPLPDISALRSNIPIKLKQIITKMTKKRVDERYKNTDEIISSLNEAVEQNKQERKEAERLAAIGHTTAQQIQAVALKKRQEEDRINEYKKFLNYHITDLFEKITLLAESVNSSMEIDKIHLYEHPYKGNLETRKLKIAFNNKTISIEFYSERVIDNNEKERLDRHKSFQIKQYGAIFDPFSGSIFKKKNIIFLGEIESNFVNPFFNERFGYNLVLVKNEVDIYGKWYVASFSDTGFSRSNRKNFALDLPDFLKEFENSFITHTLSVDYHELQDKDISNVIEEILR
ncbi:MAG: serine/threonine-protein kinase [Methylovulum miyakonense]|uniref:serine/threonine-protein kinase n=1 Tax=Methylovulum miyakonense TaxID=645578 RepID=UPI003BB76438